LKARPSFPLRGTIVPAVLVAMTLVSTPSSDAATSGYMQTNLVSDVSGAATRTDPNLVNPWGIAFGPNGPLWIADNGKGVSTLYLGNGNLVPSASAPLVVTIPPPPGSTDSASPTGMVFNDSSGFALAPGGPAVFLFATENGTISGWNPNLNMTHAVLKVDRSASAVYKGLALLGNRLYAANFRANAIDVFNSDFSSAGSFTDPRVPAGFAPFGIQNLGGRLYVTYAKQDDNKHDDVRGPGNGYVDLFNPISHRFTRLVSGGTSRSPLNSPWGLALAPANFGRFSRDLLVGNFGDGWINAFDPRTGAFRGALKEPSGQVIAIDGLWGLAFARDPNNPAVPLLFFTAGSGGEQHGLFGTLQAASGTTPGKGNPW
jgi:uncharacterized protein (TIGR03118 family)